MVLSYLALFRPRKSALSWGKALKVARELSALVAAGHVQVQGQAARQCPARIWAAAIEEMIRKRDALRLPLKNHNYLRQIVWTMADQEDARRENTHNQDNLDGNANRNDNKEQDDGLLPIERKILAKGGVLKRYGTGDSHD